MMRSSRGTLGSPSGLFAGRPYSFVRSFFGGGTLLTFISDVLEFIVGQMLDSDERILRGADAAQLVQLHLDRGAIPVLGILDQKHHQEGDDRRAGIDDQLPGI